MDDEADVTQLVLAPYVSDNMNDPDKSQDDVELLIGLVVIDIEAIRDKVNTAPVRSRGSTGQFFPQNFCQNSEYF